MVSETRPQHDEVYVISDLHLGGAAPAQIFNQTARLAWLIDALRQQPAQRDVALVLNGDTVDFLSEEPIRCFDAQGAAAKLARIFQDSTFEPVWKALGRFVRTEGRTLVLVLGNHDLELALPPVRELLLRELCGDDAAARGRVRTAFHGEGYACSVGRAKVLCVHGNEVDEFNEVDHEALRRTAAAGNRGVQPPDVAANAGTNLVVKVMNALKPSYPFIDLLKPETRAVLNLLPWLEPKSVLIALRDVAPLLVKLAQGALRVRGMLGDEPAPSGPAQTLSPDAALAQLLGGTGGAASSGSADVDALFQRVEADFAAGLAPEQLSATATPEHTLGHWQILWDRFAGADKETALRHALQDWLSGDASFDYFAPEPMKTREMLDERVADEIDFLVAGHTHLARALKRKGGGIYYNSGTWTRLIRLSDGVLADPARFAPIYRALLAGSMRALDETPGVIERRSTVVCIREDSGRTSGTLESVEGADDAHYRLGPIDDKTRFVK